MKNLYFAILYKCNQSCLGCPCGKDTFKGQYLSLEDIKKKVEIYLEKNDKISVTLSGGEPLLHEEIFDILKYLTEKSIYVTILTNGEMLSNFEFTHDLSQIVDKRKFRIVTTIHNSMALIHEQQNRSKGSYNRTINGLINARYFGLSVTVKHCITKVNYKDTLNFYKKMFDIFDPYVSYELWGIDYCGLTKKEAEDLYVEYKELKEHLELALDYFIKVQSEKKIRLSINNIPLCWVDPYYWNLFNLNLKKDNYNYYSDPLSSSTEVLDNTGKFSEHCKNCDAYGMCNGAYKTLFDYFGKDVVSALKAVE